MISMRGGSSKTRIETPENIKILDILKSMRGGSSKTRIETCKSKNVIKFGSSGMRGGSSKTRIETALKRSGPLFWKRYERRFQ